MARHDALSARQLGEIAQASLANAVSLFDDAATLHALGRTARAHALAILAGEEFGKHMMCMGAVGRDAGDEPYWRSFWRRFLRHEDKLTNFAGMAASWLPEGDRQRFVALLDRHVDASLNDKMAGFYVDYADGKVQDPSRLDPSRAEGTLDVVGGLLDLWTQHMGDVDFAAMFTTLEDKARTMQAALATRDPAVIQRVFKETTPQ